mmetsp:Transcript_42331/g.88835  ORF Transcript_42331/g.88835 Transcript_42331/m.88835 type:complete len:123 (-) Transcript_42331:1277-1645(-)|eukprot:CAMPEP_0183713494 /NCGR_PEP_ID=MMETSP0737-20130205/8320_1 /TAXON_ID=385413 /ORGANISM="Thalassiosira miniscula, Strain CCMP1093" /LENGTH=122 /DNA_ID=CAMNT_0025942279 /DNA_START=17 /DNA_END=385 /DNA_ORIENTATION=+
MNQEIVATDDASNRLLLQSCVYQCAYASIDTNRSSSCSFGFSFDINNNTEDAKVSGTAIAWSAAILSEERFQYWYEHHRNSLSVPIMKQIWIRCHVTAFDAAVDFGMDDSINSSFNQSRDTQ